MKVIYVKNWFVGISNYANLLKCFIGMFCFHFYKSNEMWGQQTIEHDDQSQT
jgi:hypothetical protein